MKKVVCARCGLVNLDKFVSFPHCAACGALLEQAPPPKWRTIWRRPVRPLYWMLAVGSGLMTLGLTIASITREARVIGDSPLLVYTQIPREVAPGQSVRVQFTLDSALQNPDKDFERVSLRLSSQMQRDFVGITIQPPPVSIERRGRGRYYLWDALPRNTALKLTLQPRAPADATASDVLQIQATLWAARYQQFEVRTSIVRTAARRGAKSGAAKNNAPPKRAAPMQSAPKVAR